MSAANLEPLIPYGCSVPQARVLLARRVEFIDTLKYPPVLVRGDICLSIGKQVEYFHIAQRLD